MKVKEVKFERSVSVNDEDVFFDDRNEVIFVWRSNVWKSSIMNSIFEKKDLVKTSSRPWKTVTANIFSLNKKIICTDLPWYWFAKLGKWKMDVLDALISWYIEERKSHIHKVVMLIDSRLWAQEKDIEMYKYLLEFELPVLVVLSKIDKLKKSEINKAIEKTKSDFFGQEVITYSSLSKDWHKELIKSIFDWIQNKK